MTIYSRFLISMHPPASTAYPHTQGGGGDTGSVGREIVWRRRGSSHRDALMRALRGGADTQAGRPPPRELAGYPTAGATTSHAVGRARARGEGRGGAVDGLGGGLEAPLGRRGASRGGSRMLANLQRDMQQSWIESHAKRTSLPAHKAWPMALRIGTEPAPSAL